MNCPNCRLPIRQGARFCAACGRPILAQPAAPLQVAATCQVCGAQNRPGVRFCSRCGKPLAAARAAPAGRLPRVPGFFRRIKGKLATLNRKRLVFAWLGILSLAATLFLVAGALRDPASVAGVDATSTPEQGLRATVQSLPSLAPTAGPLATLVEVVAPGGKIDIPRVSDEEEIEIGRESAAEFERQYPISRNPALVQRIEKIGAELLPHQPRQNLPFQFQVVDIDDINAFAMPGGFIYITRGMLNFVENDDELAGVIGHEIAHVALRHSAQQIELVTAAQAAMQRLSTHDPNLGSIYENQGAQIAVEVTSNILLRGWGREAELDADENGTLYMAAAGYDPQGILNLFSRLANYESQPSNSLERMLATHPSFSERTARVEQTIEDNLSY